MCKVGNIILLLRRKAKRNMYPKGKKHRGKKSKTVYLDIYSPCDQSMFCGLLIDFVMSCVICMVIYDIYQHCHHKPRSSWQCNATSRILPYPQCIWMKIKEPSMVPCCFMFFSHFLHWAILRTWRDDTLQGTITYPFPGGYIPEN